MTDADEANLALIKAAVQKSGPSALDSPIELPEGQTPYVDVIKDTNGEALTWVALPEE